MSRVRRLALVVLVASSGWRGSPAGAQEIAGIHQRIRFDARGGLPETWVSCIDACAGAAGPRMTMLGTGPSDGRLRWEVPGDAASTRALEALEYEVRTDGDAILLTSREPVGGVRLVHRWAAAPEGDWLDATLAVPAGARLVLESGAALAPPPLSGLARMYDGVDAVRIGPDGQAALAGPSAGHGGEWLGVRSRFWALLLRPATSLAAEADARQPDRPGIVLHAADPLRLRVYAGPIEPRRLRRADPVLLGLLFPDLWGWLGRLGFGLRWLLDRWHSVAGNWGVAILLLSLSVKVLMWPVTRVAERWQEQVHEVQSRLAPELAAIRRDFRGEDAHRRTLGVYRRHGVSPLYMLWSAFGVLIQIPVFIAAFDMLGEHVGLSGAPFLWIHDLAMPDRFAGLPLEGVSVNLLPVLMTGLTVLAARIQEAPALAAALRAGQRRRLYAMAAAFFVVLYGFPAGMVLYWTANNWWHLVTVVVRRAFVTSRGAAAAGAGTPRSG